MASLGKGPQANDAILLAALVLSGHDDERIECRVT
jgi:hypothetical protein